MSKPKLMRFSHQRYCNNCCALKERTMKTFRNVQHWWGSRVETFYIDYIREVEKSDYPISVEDKEYIYCGNCGHVIGIKNKMGFK